MSVLLIILCWWYFSCLQMYSEKFFKIYYDEQMFFFSNLCGKRDTGQFFLRNILCRSFLKSETEMLV